MINQAFRPAPGGNVTISATTSTSTTELTSDGDFRNICVTNSGTDIVYVRLGKSTVAATSADYPVLPNSQVILSKDINDKYIAVIAASGTPTVYAMPGEGL